MPIRKFQAYVDSLVNSINIQRNNMKPVKFLQKIEKVEILLNLFYEASVIVRSNSNKSIPRKDNFRH